MPNEKGADKSQSRINSMLEPARKLFFPNFKVKDHSGRKVYRVFYIIAELSFVFSISSLALSFFPSWYGAAFLESFFLPLFRPDAMAAAVSLVGLPGAVFAWLISRIEDKICGIRISELINWVYPNFFVMYFSFFISLSVIAVLAGNEGLFWPSLHAFIGVLAVLVLLCIACYQFVIRSDIQEKFALDYFANVISSAGCLDDKKRENLLKLSDYSKKLFNQEHQNAAVNTVHLWLKAFKGERLPSIEDLPSLYFQKGYDSLILHSDYFRAAWSILLPGGLATSQDVTILCSILDKLDSNSEPIRNNKVAKVSYGRCAILLGCAQYLIEESQRSRDWAVRQIYAIVYSRHSSPAIQELLCAYMTMLSIEWINGTPKALQSMAFLSDNMQHIFDECLLKDHGGKPGTPLSVFLFHAQWIARSSRQMTATALLIRISCLLRSKSLANGAFLDLTAPKDQKDLLIILLSLASSEGEKEKREGREN